MSVNLETVNMQNTSLSKKSAWSDGSLQKDAKYYESLKEKYESYIKGNEFLTISEAVDAVKTRTIFLLAIDVRTQRLIGVSKETLEEALKSFKIGPEILARMSNALWDILLATVEEAKKLAGSTLATNSVRLQTDYLATRRTKMAVHGVLVHISRDRLGATFARLR